MDTFTPKEPQTILVGFDKKKKHTFFYYSLVFAVKGNAIKEYDLQKGKNLSGKLVGVITDIIDLNGVCPVINIGELESSSTGGSNVVKATLKRKS